MENVRVDLILTFNAEFWCICPLTACGMLSAQPYLDQWFLVTVWADIDLTSAQAGKCNFFF